MPARPRLTRKHTDMEQDPKDPWLGTLEVAESFGVSESQVRKLIYAGRLIGSQHNRGGKWLVRKSERDRYLKAIEAPNLIAVAA